MSFVEKFSGKLSIVSRTGEHTPAAAADSSQTASGKARLPPKPASHTPKASNITAKADIPARPVASSDGRSGDTRRAVASNPRAVTADAGVQLSYSQLHTGPHVINSHVNASIPGNIQYTAASAVIIPPIRHGGALRAAAVSSVSAGEGGELPPEGKKQTPKPHENIKNNGNMPSPAAFHPPEGSAPSSGAPPTSPLRAYPPAGAEYNASSMGPCFHTGSTGHSSNAYGTHSQSGGLYGMHPGYIPRPGSFLQAAEVTARTSRPRVGVALLSSVLSHPPMHSSSASISPSASPFAQPVMVPVPAERAMPYQPLPVPGAASIPVQAEKPGTPPPRSPVAEPTQATATKDIAKSPITAPKRAKSSPHATEGKPRRRIASPSGTERTSGTDAQEPIAPPPRKPFVPRQKRPAAKSIEEHPQPRPVEERVHSVDTALIAKRRAPVTKELLTPLDKLAFSKKRRSVTVVPKTFHDLENAREALGLGIVDRSTGHIVYQQLPRSLGPEPPDEELLAKRAARERAFAYADQARGMMLAKSQKPTYVALSPGSPKSRSASPSSAEAAGEQYDVVSELPPSPRQLPRSMSEAGESMLRPSLHSPSNSSLVALSPRNRSAANGESAGPFHHSINYLQERRGSARESQIAAAMALRDKALEFAKHVPMPRGSLSPSTKESSGGGTTVGFGITPAMRDLEPTRTPEPLGSSKQMPDRSKSTADLLPSHSPSTQPLKHATRSQHGTRAAGAPKAVHAPMRNLTVKQAKPPATKKSDVLNEQEARWNALGAAPSKHSEGPAGMSTDLTPGVSGMSKGRRMSNVGIAPVPEFSLPGLDVLADRHNSMRAAVDAIRKDLAW